MRAIIVEDELNVREGFTKLLKAFCPSVQVVGVAADIESSIDLIQQTIFDILFLDINLPDGSGFDLLNRLKARDFKVVFITAYDQYALEAFKISAVDYLLKPVSPDLLINAVRKVKESQNKLSDDQLGIISNRISRNISPQDKMILKDADSMQIVLIRDIVYCTAEGSYTTFNLINGSSILTSLNLKEYERLLEPYGFARSHHSYLINLNHVVSLQKADGGTILMKNQVKLPVSTRKKSGLIEALRQRFVS